MAETKQKVPGGVPTYKDINLSFIKHPKTGDISTVTNNEAIKRSIKHLVISKFFERPFEPEIGSDVTNLLFELKSPFTTLFITDAITRVINNFEPRAKILDVLVNEGTDKNYYNVYVLYKFMNKNIEISFNIDLQKVR